MIKPSGLKALFFSLISMLINLEGWEADAQVFNHTVITSKYDTIDNVYISPFGKETNYQKVTFFDRDGEQYQYTAPEILGHYNGRSYYRAFNVENRDQKYLLSLMINGPVKLYESTINPRVKGYYLEVSGSKKIYPLEDYQQSLDSLFSRLIPRYFEFRTNYNWHPILYSERSVANAITAYNTDNSPLRGNGGYDLTAEIYMGIMGGIEGAWFAWNGEYSLSDRSVPFGLFFVLEYDRMVSINGLFHHQKYRFTGREDDVGISRITFEPYISYKYYYNPKITINPGAGATVSWNYKGVAYNPISAVPTNVQVVSAGWRASVDVQYLRRYMISLTYLHSVIPMDFGIFADLSKEKGNINSARLSLVYFLK